VGFRGPWLRLDCMENNDKPSQSVQPDGLNERQKGMCRCLDGRVIPELPSEGSVDSTDRGCLTRQTQETGSVANQTSKKTTDQTKAFKTPKTRAEFQNCKEKTSKKGDEVPKLGWHQETK